MKNFAKKSLTFLFCSATMLQIGCTKQENKSETKASEKMDKNAPSDKVFVFGRKNEPRSLDPQFQFDQASGEIVGEVYDTLLQYHYLKRPYQLEPNLLKSMPQYTGKDGLTMVFELKEGVKFIDNKCFTGGKGRELTADDVLYSIKRFADIHINVNSWFMLDGAIVGLNEYREKTKSMPVGKVDHKTEQVAGLKKIDKYKFSIELTQKNPLVLFALAVSSLSIVPHEAVDTYGDTFRYNPVGTGPFYLEEYKKQQKMVLIKNPNYHGRYPTEGEPGDLEKGLLVDAGKQLPFIDRVEMPYIPEDQPLMLKFKKGELSWRRFDRDNFASMAFKNDKEEFLLKDEYAAKYNIYGEPELRMEYLSFNLKDKLLQNKKLRQAMAYGLDTKGYIDLMWNGRGKTLSTIVPRVIAGSEDDIGSQMFGYDLEKAKKLLAEAGYPEGKGLPPITLTIRNTDTFAKNSFEFYRANYAKMGIVLKSEFLTFSKYLKAVDDANFQMSESAWGADYPDAENFYQLLYGANKAPGPNISSFDNPDFNKSYEISRLMENSPERFEHFKTMSQILKDEAPVVPIFNLTQVGMIQKWVRNFKRNMMMERQLRYLDVDTQRLAKGVDGNVPN